MKQTTLIRTAKTPEYTKGVWFIDGFMCYVLERPDLNNAPNISCIPPGEYTATFLPRSASGKWRNVYHVLNVPGRSGIFVHVGNVVKQTRGCILPGMKQGTLGGAAAVLQSGTAMRKLRAALGREDFNIRII